MIRNHRSPLVQLAALALALTAAPAAGQEDEDPMAEYRHNFMQNFKGHISDAYLIVSGGVELDGHLQIHARALAEQAAKLLEVFPEGSGGPDTRALPVIWEDWPAFQQAAAKVERATGEFRAAVESDAAPAELAARFKAVGEACKGCHERFRAEED